MKPACTHAGRYFFRKACVVDDVSAGTHGIDRLGSGVFASEGYKNRIDASDLSCTSDTLRDARRLECRMSAIGQGEFSFFRIDIARKNAGTLEAGQQYVQLSHRAATDDEDVVAQLQAGPTDAVNDARDRLTECQLIKRLLIRHRKELPGGNYRVVGKSADAAKDAVSSSLHFAGTQIRFAATTSVALHTAIEEGNGHSHTGREADDALVMTCNDNPGRFMTWGNRIFALSPLPESLLHRAQSAGANLHENFATAELGNWLRSQFDLAWTGEYGYSVFVHAVIF